jgi:hypothetical protein
MQTDAVRLMPTAQLSSHTTIAHITQPGIGFGVLPSTFPLRAASPLIALSMHPTALNISRMSCALFR